MRQASLSAFWGPLLVLYLVVDATASGHVAPSGMFVAAAALLCALLGVPPGGLARGRSGQRRMQWLGVALGGSLIRYVDPSSALLLADVTQLLGRCLVAVLLLDLALTVPDRLPLARLGLVVRALYGLSLIPCLLELLALAPAMRVVDELWIVPPFEGRLALWTLTVSAGLSVAARTARQAPRSTPEGLTDNRMAQLGLMPATVLLAYLAGSAPTRAALAEPLHGPLLAVSALLLGFSHRKLVDVEQRVHAGRTTRRGVTGLVASALACTVAGLLSQGLPAGSWAGFSGALLGAIALLVFLVSYRVLWQPLDRLLAPARGVLLSALRQSGPQEPWEERPWLSRRLEDLAAPVLQRLRSAGFDAAGEPRLYTLVPERCLTLDAAGVAHALHVGPPKAVLGALRAHPSGIIDWASVEARRVREPVLRPLLDALVELDALCVVPVVLEGELEGAFTVPRGRRRSALTLEELTVLGRFAQSVAVPLSALNAEARAAARAHQAISAAERFQEHNERLSDELEAVRAGARLLRAGRVVYRHHEPPVAYSASMRALMSRLQPVAASDAPLNLVAEEGTEVESLAFHIHQQGGRGDGVFLVADCAAVPEGPAMEALFGDGAGEPGLFNQAAEGTLLLLDVPALPLSVQGALAEALASRTVQPVSGGEPNPLTARLITTMREEPGEAARAERLDGALGQRLSSLTLEVPPLRRREGDLESLLLLALARAARQHGKQPVGMEEEVRALLLAYDYPGNGRELRAIVEHAVRSCSGRRVARAHLPLPFQPIEEAEVEEVADPLDDTFDGIEAAALRHALLRSGGNKSEAARRLGLKRTTFLDKLRRHQVEETPSRRPRAGR